MDAILLRQVRVVDKRSPWNGQVCDVRVREGRIVELAAHLPETGQEEVVEKEGLHVSPGWVDLQCFGGEPGYPERETWDSLWRAAAAGGFTRVLLMPDLWPVTDQEPAVQALVEATRSLPVEVMVCAALTMGMEGRDMTEMLNLAGAGAAAFSDGLNTVRDSARFTAMLEYASMLSKPVLHRPGTPELEKGLWAAESPEAVAAGLQGVPAQAETIGLFRDMEVGRYTGARLHLHPVTTQEALQVARFMAPLAPQVTLGTHASYLFLDDPAPGAFDPYRLLWPPLRGREDAEALREACRQGAIRAVASGHRPLNPEIKEHEPALATPGMIALESAFAMTWTALQPRMSLEDVVDLWALGPREILGLECPVVNAGQKAELTLFDPVREWVFSEQDIRSRSRNTPLIGTLLKGKPLGIVAKGCLTLP
ncbi:MAG: dihydroorotase [Flavobacteriales bacterium]|nr:dihydroorotase [Flavobacteriales bacterium]MCX7649447.1 dihydroorotase [Flavobacteriales bacterium]MDW8432557.1 dihydroorotase [Flavobacteriales bacterium]